MDWTETLEIHPHKKYMKDLWKMNGLSPISYILDPVEDEKNLYHDLICPYCLEDAKSAPSSELCEPAEQGSYFFQA